jgi:hypothetical protein
MEHFESMQNQAEQKHVTGMSPQEIETEAWPYSFEGVRLQS